MKKGHYNFLIEKKNKNKNKAFLLKPYPKLAFLKMFDSG